MHETRGEPATHDDPLADPSWPIFIYSAWALCSWYVDVWLGLAILVGATAALAVVSLRRQTLDSSPPFVTDFNVVLLFCAASIGATVLMLEAFNRSPDIFGATAAYGAAAAIVIDARRRNRREYRRLHTE